MAGSSPGWVDGHVASAAEWNALWAGKVDATNGAFNGSVGLTTPGPGVFTTLSSTGAYTPGSIVFSGSRVWSGSSFTTNPINAQNISWTGTNTGGNFTSANYIAGTDLTNSGIAAGNGFGLMTLNLISGGASKIGQANTLDTFMTFNATSGNTIAGGNSGTYSAFRATTNIMANDNGISGTYWGNAFGGNAVVQLFPGATWFGQAVGFEIDVGMQAGSSAADKIGLQIVLLAGDAVQGARDDVGLSLNSQYTQTAGKGLKVGIEFGRLGGYFPMDPTGTLIGAAAIGGTKIVALGIDWSGVTFTNRVFNMPGFFLDGAGKVQAAEIATATATRVNGIDLIGSATGGPPVISTFSSVDTNVGLNAVTKGSGVVGFFSAAGSNQTFAINAVAGSDGYIVASPGIAASQMPQLSGAGTANNILLGGPAAGGALANGATTGFAAMPFTNGIPTGVPVNNAGGAVFETNATSKNLNIYIPGVGWYHAALTVGAA